MVYNDCMSVTERFLADILDALRARVVAGTRMPGGTVSAELKKLGLKAKTCGTDVYCDIGRGANRLAFRADGTEQTAMLLALARAYCEKPPVPMRLIFRTDAETDATANSDKPVDGIAEIYALRFDDELDAGTFGCGYGTVAAGYIEFELDFAHGDAERACDRTVMASIIAAKDCGADLTIERVPMRTCARGVMRFYNAAASEDVLLRIERAALAADDALGTEHALVTREVFMPTVNDALSVDLVRSVAGDAAKELSRRGDSDDFSEYLSIVRGCLIYVGTAGGSETAVRAGAELFEKLVRTHMR